MSVHSKLAGSWVGAALVAVIGCAAQARAAPPATPHEWLEWMVEAMRTTNYAGLFVYRQGPEMLETMRIVHRGGEEGGHERLYSLNGVAREIIRDGDRVTCILPDSNSVMVDRRRARNPLASLLPSDIDSITRHYHLEASGRFRVAGREAKRLRIQAADGYRYGYRFWVDVKTGLMLRADLIHDDEALEQIMFTELELPERIPDAWLQPELSGRGFTWYRTDEKRKLPDDDAPRHWRIGFVPAGFELQVDERRIMPVGTDTPVEHRLYSDGVAAVSVYVSALDTGQGRFEGLSRMGAFSAFGRVVDDHQVVAMGAVPPRTVMTVAESVTMEAEADGT